MNQITLEERFTLATEKPANTNGKALFVRATETDGLSLLKYDLDYPLVVAIVGERKAEDVVFVDATGEATRKVVTTLEAQGIQLVTFANTKAGWNSIAYLMA